MPERHLDSGQEPSSGKLASSVQRVSVVLKVAALVLAASSVIAAFVNATTDLNEFYGGPPVDLPWRVKLSNFLQSAIPNLAWSALVLAAAFAIEIAVAHLERPRSTGSEATQGDSRSPPVDGAVDDSMWSP